MSLYNNGFIVNYRENDKSLQRDHFEYKEDINDKLYTVKEGDNLTRLAFKFYKDPLKWYLIADINEIFNPFILEPGQELIIPNPSRYGRDN